MFLLQVNELNWKPISYDILFIILKTHFFNPTESIYFIKDAFMLSNKDTNRHEMGETPKKCENDSLKNDFIIGTIHSRCNPVQIIQRTHMNLVKLFEKQHNLIPSDIIIHGNQSISFPYIPNHLQYIVFSILKNAM